MTESDEMRRARLLRAEADALQRMEAIRLAIKAERTLLSMGIAGGYCEATQRLTEELTALEKTFAKERALADAARKERGDG